MPQEFICEDFLLHSKTARTLYHDHAAKMPVYDYHCHLPAEKIAADHNFGNLTQIWLAGDHYKWRAMRTFGVPEKFITGSASDLEKFRKWAATLPYCIANPLYTWAHIELKRFFGINELLNPDTAETFYNVAAELLRLPQFSARSLLKKANVELICTTESPLDSLEHHKKIRDEKFEIKVHTCFRPDCCLAVEDISAFNVLLDKLEEICNTEITSFASFIEALRDRHHYFHQNLCRLSDYGLETIYVQECSQSEVEKIFIKIRKNISLDSAESLKFKSAVLFELALMDAEAGWVMQLHIGALRNTNSRILEKLGPDAGCDSISDVPIARPLAKFLDSLNSIDRLPKTILYNLNPAYNELFTAMTGSFQDGSVPGKIQYGPAWWFLDQIDGIQKHLTALANLSLLSTFIGMTTDSRSFLSFSRHEYFRRILCNFLGGQVEQGLLPNDLPLLAKIIEDISFNNAKSYFPMQLD
jgi:glucuronate isomerase